MGKTVVVLSAASKSGAVFCAGAFEVLARRGVHVVVCVGTANLLAGWISERCSECSKDRLMSFMQRNQATENWLRWLLPCLVNDDLTGSVADISPEGGPLVGSSSPQILCVGTVTPLEVDTAEDAHPYRHVVHVSGPPVDASAISTMNSAGVCFHSKLPTDAAARSVIAGFGVPPDAGFDPVCAHLEDAIVRQDEDVFTYLSGTVREPLDLLDPLEDDEDDHQRLTSSRRDIMDLHHFVSLSRLSDGSMFDSAVDDDDDTEDHADDDPVHVSLGPSRDDPFAFDVLMSLQPDDVHRAPSRANSVIVVDATSESEARNQAFERTSVDAYTRLLGQTRGLLTVVMPSLEEETTGLSAVHDFQRLLTVGGATAARAVSSM